MEITYRNTFLYNYISIQYVYGYITRSKVSTIIKKTYSDSERNKFELIGDVSKT